MLLVIPHNTRLTHRRINAPLRTWLSRFAPGWNRDKISVVITERADKVTEEQHFVHVDLSSGRWYAIGSFDWRRMFIPIQPGSAVIAFDHKAALSVSEATIHVGLLSSIYETQDDLLVARDAFQAGDARTAQNIARRALPHGHALYDVLLRLEQKYLARC